MPALVDVVRAELELACAAIAGPIGEGNRADRRLSRAPWGQRLRFVQLQRLPRAGARSASDRRRARARSGNGSRRGRFAPCDRRHPLYAALKISSPSSRGPSGPRFRQRLSGEYRHDPGAGRQK